MLTAPITYVWISILLAEQVGSNGVQNILFPQLGAANTPYARTVQPQTLQPHTLPEPEVLFDSVLARKKFEEHPNKISSVLFYLASIIIHGMLAILHYYNNHPSDSSFRQISSVQTTTTLTIL